MVPKVMERLSRNDLLKTKYRIRQGKKITKNMPVKINIFFFILFKGFVVVTKRKAAHR